MILLHDLRLAIMTPPKCATNSLHAAFRTRSDMESYVGPSPAVDGGFDRHCNIWPHEVKRYKKLVVVRNPFERFVSLYLHLAVRLAGRGLASPSFGEYARIIVEHDSDYSFGDGLATAMYCWNLSRWLLDVEYDSALHVEDLLNELKPYGIDKERKELPRLNIGYRASGVEFYTSELRALVGRWAEPDMLRWYP